MSVEVLRVSGDYKIITASGGSNLMTVDSPELRVTGNLTVLGTTTTVESTVTTIADPIITLNEGESGAGVTLGQSGIEVERGTASNATMLFDDTLSYTMPNGGAGEGMFTFKVGSTLGGLRVHHIETTGEDLVLLGSNASNAVVSVRGTANYENQVTDDDDIPNKKYVDNAIVTSPGPQIKADDTVVYVEDYDLGAPYSRAYVKIDNTQRLEVNQYTIELGDITVDGTTIRPNNSGDSLFLESNGAGEVVARDVLSIEGTVIPSAPTADSGRLKLYVQTEDVGGTGLYFVNTSSTRDELVSKKKALLMSMLF